MCYKWNYKYEYFIYINAILISNQSHIIGAFPSFKAVKITVTLSQCFYLRIRIPDPDPDPDPDLAAVYLPPYHSRRFLGTQHGRETLTRKTSPMTWRSQSPNWPIPRHGRERLTRETNTMTWRIHFKWALFAAQWATLAGTKAQTPREWALSCRTALKATSKPM